MVLQALRKWRRESWSRKLSRRVEEAAGKRTLFARTKWAERARLFFGVSSNITVNLISIYLKTSRNWVTWLPRPRYKKLLIETKLCCYEYDLSRGPSRAALNISRKGGKRGRKWQWEKKRRMREGRSSARWLYGMSRLCLARVRNVIHTPLAFRHVPFRSRLRLLLQARCVPLRGLSPTRRSRNSGDHLSTYVRAKDASLHDYDRLSIARGESVGLLPPFGIPTFIIPACKNRPLEDAPWCRSTCELWHAMLDTIPPAVALALIEESLFRYDTKVQSVLKYIFSLSKRFQI